MNNIDRLDAMLPLTTTNADGTLNYHDKQNINMNMNPLFRFLGIPQTDPYKAQYDMRYRNFDLPKYYQDGSVFLGEFVRGLILGDRNSFLTDPNYGIPLRATDQQHFNWTETKFDTPLLRVEPEQGVPFLFRSGFEQNSATTTRYGIGLFFENGFLFTSAGLTHFARSLQVIRNAVTLTIEWAILAKLMLIMPRDREFRIMTERAKLTDFIQILQLHAKNFACFQKSRDGAINRIMQARNALINEPGGVTPSSLIIPHGGKIFFRGSGKALEFMDSGNRGVNKREQNPENINSFMDLKVITITDYRDQPDRGARLLEPLTRERINGGYLGFYGAGLNVVLRNIDKYVSDHRSIRFYNFDDDEIAELTIREAVEKSPIWNDHKDVNGDTWMRGVPPRGPGIGDFITYQHDGVTHEKFKYFQPKVTYQDWDLFSMRLGGAGSLVKSHVYQFGDLSLEYFPHPLFNAVIRSVIAKGKGTVIPAYKQEEERPKLVISTNTDTSLILKKIHEELSHDKTAHMSFFASPVWEVMKPFGDMTVSDSVHRDETGLTYSPDYYKNVIGKARESFRDFFGGLNGGTITSDDVKRFVGIIRDVELFSDNTYGKGMIQVIDNNSMAPPTAPAEDVVDVDNGEEEKPDVPPGEFSLVEEDGDGELFTQYLAEHPEPKRPPYIKPVTTTRDNIVRYDINAHGIDRNKNYIYGKGTEQLIISPEEHARLLKVVDKYFFADPKEKKILSDEDQAKMHMEVNHANTVIGTQNDSEELRYDKEIEEWRNKWMEFEQKNKKKPGDSITGVPSASSEPDKHAAPKAPTPSSAPGARVKLVKRFVTNTSTYLKEGASVAGLVAAFNTSEIRGLLSSIKETEKDWGRYYHVLRKYNTEAAKARANKYDSLRELRNIGYDDKLLPYNREDVIDDCLNNDAFYEKREAERKLYEEKHGKKIKYDIKLPDKWKIVDFDFLLDVFLVVNSPELIVKSVGGISTVFSGGPGSVPPATAFKLVKDIIAKLTGPHSVVNNDDVYNNLRNAYAYMVSQNFIVTENELEPMNVNIKKFYFEYFREEINIMLARLSDTMKLVVSFDMLYTTIKASLAEHVSKGNHGDFVFNLNNGTTTFPVFTVPADYLKVLHGYTHFFGSVFEIKNRAYHLKNITKRYAPTSKSPIEKLQDMARLAVTTLSSKLKPMSIEQIHEASKDTVFNTESLKHLASVLPQEKAASLIQSVSHLVTLAKHKPEETSAILLNDLHTPLKSLSDRRGTAPLSGDGEASFHRMIDSFIQNANTKIQKEQQLEEQTRVGAKISLASVSARHLESHPLNIPSRMLAHSIITQTAGSRGAVGYYKAPRNRPSNYEDPFDLEGLRDDGGMDEEKADNGMDAFTDAWNARLEFLASYKDKDPLYYNTGIQIMHWKNTKKQHLDIIDNDFVYPFNVIAFRFSRKYETVSSILGKFGKETGFVAVGNANFLFGTDVATKTHEGHFTIYIGVIIYGTKNYVMLSDLYIKRYMGGSGVEFYTKEDIDDLRLNNFNPPNALHRPSIVTTLMPYGYRPLKFVDVRGYFNGSVVAQNEYRPPTYITTDAFYKALDFNNSEVSVPVFVEGETTANYLCGQEWQLIFNYDHMTYNSEVMAEDCLGNILYQGAKAVFEMHDPSTAILDENRKQTGLVPAVW